MADSFLIVGAGIAGLSTAMALLSNGVPAQEIRIIEQADELSEVGAGIQLGPNAMRILQLWGLAKPLQHLGCLPSALVVRDGRTDDVLTRRTMDDALSLFGAPYLTVRRADLQVVLLQAVVSAGVSIQFGTRWDVALGRGYSAILGCDGLHSQVRGQVLSGTRHAGSPKATGHMAYRAMLPLTACPDTFQQNKVQVWLDAHLHAVVYPVNERQLNVVIAQSKTPSRDAVQSSLLQALIATAQDHSGFSEWPLFDRPPLLAPKHYVSGNMALLGDAAHPMRPYLAQGAAMAIEDAHALGAACASSVGERPASLDIPRALQTFALARWRRNAHVQLRSQLQGYAFHASGATRMIRNALLQVAGRQITAMRWLYA
jgi:salicylate hydroxylase